MRRFTFQELAYIIISNPWLSLISVMKCAMLYMCIGAVNKGKGQECRQISYKNYCAEDSDTEVKACKKKG